MTIDTHQALDFTLTALCVYREARGEPLEGKRAVAFVIRNRTLQPGWWGHDWASIILHPYQFSAFNWNNQNVHVWPAKSETAWQECLQVSEEAWTPDFPDPTGGATHYFDDSIKPPLWSKNMTQTLRIGRLTFFR